MNDISIYLVKLHNSMHYRQFSQATSNYSAVISRKLAEISEQDLRHAEIMFENGQAEASEILRLNPFDVDLAGEASDYTQEILAAVIEEEKYLAGIFKKDDLRSLWNATVHRVSDLEKMLEHLRDGSLFGLTVRSAISSQRRGDCICTACGFMFRHLVDGPQYFPEECPCCGAGQGLFVRRLDAGGW